MLNTIFFARILLSTLISSFGLFSPNSDGIIRGKVTDLSGNPIQDCKVQIVGDTLIKEVITSSSGDYSIDGVDANHVTVSFSCVGFKRENVAAVLGPSTVIIIDLGLEPGQLSPLSTFTVSGQVKTKPGKPVANAKISLRNIFNARIVTEVNSATGKESIPLRFR